MTGFRQRSTVRLAVLAIGVVAVPLMVVVALAAPAKSGALSSQFIAYVNTPNRGLANIWTMQPDGTGQAQITILGGDQPAISPDGSQIVFTSRRDGGSEEVFPDSSQTVSTSGSAGGSEEIYLMNADGTGQTRLTTNNARDIGPSWSPDGSKILFASDISGQWQIWTMVPDGSGVTRVVSNGNNDASPRFSPDGTKIVFTSDRSGTLCIWTMNADGTSPFQVTGDSTSADYPAWSPDGARIAFASDRTPAGPDIYTISPSGTNEMGAISGQFAQAPQWSPDSAKLVAQSPRNGNWDIYSMNADGSGQSRLTTADGVDSAPFWGPIAPVHVSSTVSTTSSVTEISDESIVPAFTG